MVDFTQETKRGRAGRILGTGAVLAVILLGVLALSGGGSPDLSPTADDTSPPLDAGTASPTDSEGN